jgi:hypothetical protein
MHSRSFSFITFAGVLILALACSGDNLAGPGAPAQINTAGAPLSSTIKSDVAGAAGNAIAGDLESLVANEAAAVGSFAVFAPSSPSFEGDTPSSPPPSTDSAKPPASTPPSGEPQPAPAPATSAESCSFNADALLYTCTKVTEGKTVVKSYQFLDASSKAMEKFVRGTTESIHYLVKTDSSEARDNYTTASHSLRDVTVSGFLGPNRVWNGFGSSADTNSYKDELSTREYTGLSADTLKAVTFVDERSTHPYPLSGVAVRVVDYTAVSTGKQVETTTVHRRVVVTFNGTADVPISLGDYACVLHLDTHKVDGCR